MKLQLGVGGKGHKSHCAKLHICLDSNQAESSAFCLCVSIKFNSAAPMY